MISLKDLSKHILIEHLLWNRQFASKMKSKENQEAVCIHGIPNLVAKVHE